MCKYGIFVAKIYKYAPIDSFQGFSGSLDSAANCAALIQNTKRENIKEQSQGLLEEIQQLLEQNRSLAKEREEAQVFVFS